ncbi:MAG: transposase family protein [Mycobacterium sp.]
MWPCWSWAGERELWAGKYKTTGHGSLIVTNLAGRLTFVSEPVPGNQHDMAKLQWSECEMILKLAGGVIGDKGFIGPDYITTPVRKPQDRDLYMREHDYNNQISSLRAPVERAIANLKTWRILFRDYRRPLKTFSSSFRAAIGLYSFKEGFRISLGVNAQKDRSMEQYREARNIWRPIEKAVNNDPSANQEVQERYNGILSQPDAPKK